MPAIRPERTGDHATIASVVAAAFGSETEAILVARIRASDRYLPRLSLVAEEDGAVVGHVMVSHAELDDEGTRHRVAVLAPLAVCPDLQRRGIGSALVRAVLAAADAMEEPMVVLEGGPRYYGALGFEHSVRYGITIDLPEWAPPEAAQVYRLGGYDPSVRGRLILPEAFDGLE